MVLNSRSKGQRGERQVKDIFQKVMDEVGNEIGLPWIPEVKRNLMQTMEGGADLVGIPGFAVEVKFCENLQIEKWWEQAQRQARSLDDWATHMNQPLVEALLVFRQKNRPWQVCMMARLETHPYECDGGMWRVQLSLDDFLRWFEHHLRAWWALYPPKLQSVFVPEQKHPAHQIP